MATGPSIPRIEQLSVRNYRALRDLQFKGLTPLTALLGPNGSGKSTVFDVFAFLSECFTVGLRKAWDQRGRFKDLRTRGARGPISIELKYREVVDSPLITYRLDIDEDRNGPFVAEERLQWRQGAATLKILDFVKGEGRVASDSPNAALDLVAREKLDSPETLAAAALGQLTRYPEVNRLRRFITDWYLSCLTAECARNSPQAGPQERLSTAGDNLPNVLQYLEEQHPERLRQILKTLSRRVPQLERVDAEVTPDGRLLLQIKDMPFEKPIPAQYASDGTLKMLAYLLVLNDPQPPQLIGVEEPESHLHPRLLSELAEECRVASAQSQLIVTTHSPFFVNGLRPEEVWALFRDEYGYTQARRVADMQGIKEFMMEGALLGQLWAEGYLDIGDPFIHSNGPRTA